MVLPVVLIMARVLLVLKAGASAERLEGVKGFVITSSLRAGVCN